MATEEHNRANGSNNTTNDVPYDGRNKGEYLEFPILPPGGPLNRWSHKITREHDFPGAQVRFKRWSWLLPRCGQSMASSCCLRGSTALTGEH
jgi:hypothetical protein